MLYSSRSLLVICFIYTSVYTSALAINVGDEPDELFCFSFPGP